MVTRISIDEYQRQVESQSDESNRHDALHNAVGRIKQLERLNATLSGEIDAQRPVVQAACRWARNDKGFLRIHLRTAVINYEAAKAAKDQG